jgi:hypothetical protein
MKSRKMRWEGHVARMGEMGNVYNMVVGKLEGKRPLGRPRRRWYFNIEWILQKQDGNVWIGYILLRIGTSGRFL